MNGDRYVGDANRFSDEIVGLGEGTWVLRRPMVVGHVSNHKEQEPEKEARIMGVETAYTVSCIRLRCIVNFM